MQIASAGMAGPFVLSYGRCRALELVGIPPGLFANSTYEAQSIALQPGNAVLFCSDGITEAMNLEGESFGLERLQAVCEQCGHLDSTALLGGILREVDQFSGERSQHDDMAAAIFVCTA